MSDYDSVVRILNQGQALHINWRPDIYKPNDALLPKAVFEEIVKGDTFYIAENEGNVIGILELISCTGDTGHCFYRHNGG